MFTNRKVLFVLFVVTVLALAITSYVSFPTTQAMSEDGTYHTLNALPAHEPIIVNTASMSFYAGSMAQPEGVARPDACRTYHVYAHESEQQGETDALFCDVSIITPEPIVTIVTTYVVHHNNDNNAPIVTSTPSVPVVVTPAPTDDAPSCPVCVEPTKVRDSDYVAPPTTTNTPKPEVESTSTPCPTEDRPAK